jgi:hypothetical protein
VLAGPARARRQGGSGGTRVASSRLDQGACPPVGAAAG